MAVWQFKYVTNVKTSESISTNVSDELEEGTQTNKPKSRIVCLYTHVESYVALNYTKGILGAGNERYDEILCTNKPMNCDRLNDQTIRPVAPRQSTWPV